MLGKELIDAQSLAGAGQRVEGRVALAQRHGIAKTIENGPAVRGSATRRSDRVLRRNSAAHAITI